MIKESDLIEAIAECQGERNPNANTCIKLAAYYTILDHIRNKEEKEEAAVQYSYDPPPMEIYSSESEFGQLVYKSDYWQVMRIIDELMETLRVMHPRLYDAVMRKITVLE